MYVQASRAAFKSQMVKIAVPKILIYPTFIEPKINQAKSFK